MPPAPSNSGALWAKLIYSSKWSFSGSLLGGSGRSPELAIGVELEFEFELELELKLQLETDSEPVLGIQD